MSDDNIEIRYTWFSIARPNGTPIYGYGTEAQADELAGLKDKEAGLEIDLYQVREVTDPEEIRRLDDGCGDFNLADELQAARAMLNKRPHHHEPAVSRACPSLSAIWLTYRETCECGAERLVSVSGSHREMSEWIDFDWDADRMEQMRLDEMSAADDDDASDALHGRPL